MRTAQILFLVLLSSCIFMTACKTEGLKEYQVETTELETEVVVNTGIQDKSTENTIFNTETVIVPDKGEFYGTINWDNDLWLATEQGKIPLQIQEDTKFYNIPSERITESQKNIMEEVGVDYLWFGLVADLSKYLVQGDSVKIIGAPNDKDPFKYIVFEIYFN